MKNAQSFRGELLKHRKRWSELMKGSLKVTNLEMSVLFPYIPDCLVSFHLIQGQSFWSCLLCMLLFSSDSSLAVSLFRSINLLLLLQGHCHLSNRQQTLLVMDAPHREREKVVVHGQTRHPARLPHGMMAPKDDGYVLYDCLGSVFENLCRHSCRPLGENVASENDK